MSKRLFYVQAARIRLRPNSEDRGIYHTSKKRGATLSCVDYVGVYLIIQVSKYHGHLRRLALTSIYVTTAAHLSCISI